MQIEFQRALYPVEGQWNSCFICYADFEPGPIWVWIDGEELCERCLRWFSERAEKEPELGWPTFAEYEELTRRYPTPIYETQEGSEERADYWEQCMESWICR